jgi:hypothetical protein
MSAPDITPAPKGVMYQVSWGPVYAGWGFHRSNDTRGKVVYFCMGWLTFARVEGAGWSV